MTNTDGTLHVYKNENIDWVIAASPEDANAVLVEMLGGDATDLAPSDWTLLPDHQQLTIRDECRGLERRTCAEWVAQEGRSFLGSTEY